MFLELQSAAVCCLLLACDSWTAVSCYEANGGVIKLCGSLGVPRFTPPHCAAGSLSESTFRSQTSQPALRNETTRGSDQCNRSQTLCLRTFQPHRAFFFVYLSFISALMWAFSDRGIKRAAQGPVWPTGAFAECKKCSKLLNTFSLSEKRSTAPAEAMTAWVEILLERL